MQTTGLDSLLNEYKLNGRFTRGQTIKYIDHTGIRRKGKYVMASSDTGYIVVNVGGRYGVPAVVPITNVIK